MSGARSTKFLGLARAFGALCLLILLTVRSPAMAAPDDQDTTSSSAKVHLVERLTLLKTADLNFGMIIPGSTPGTVVIAPDGTRTKTGGVTLAGNRGHPAEFAGYGRFNRLVTLRVGANFRNVTRVNGTETMRFDTFIVGSTPTAQLTTAPLAFRIGSPSGVFTFPVGATLRVNANQAPGVYVGSFDVTIVYQ